MTSNQSPERAPASQDEKASSATTSRPVISPAAEKAVGDGPKTGITNPQRDQPVSASLTGKNGGTRTVESTKPSFLYVDDDPLSREVMSLLMHNVLGYDEVTIFERNDDFMTRVRSLRKVPDVVFLDIQMTPHDGYTMLRMLREDPAYVECKIIAMTASVMATDVEALKKAGFDGLIGKPIMHRVFPDLLKQILTGQMVWFIA